MKREGLIHGSSVRVSRQGWGPAHGHKPSRKPTSASKCHQKKATGGNPYFPKDSIAKTTSSYKAKGMDINKNLLMTDWSVRKRRLQCDHLFEDDSASGSDYEGEDDVLEESYVREGRDGSEIVLSLDSLVVGRRRKSPSTGLQQALPHGAFSPPSGHLRFARGDELGLDEIWWGLDLLDEEEVVDDWILLDEAHGQEGFSLFSVDRFD